MLDRYFLRPKTVDRIRSSWIGEAIDNYVTWLAERGYAARTIYRRVPILVRFGEFTREHGAHRLEDLPAHLDPFATAWLAERPPRNQTRESRKKLAEEIRNPIRQMLCLVVPNVTGGGRSRKPPHPFEDQAPRFLDYLRQERGLREASLRHYSRWLREFAAYLTTVGLKDLAHLSPPVLTGFITDLSSRVAAPSICQASGVLRVFLRYLAREQVLAKDLSRTVEAPQAYRLAKVPRSITWDEVRRMLEAVDRRTFPGLNQLGRTDRELLAPRFERLQRDAHMVAELVDVMQLSTTKGVLPRACL